jgi:cytochrome c
MCCIERGLRIYDNICASCRTREEKKIENVPVEDMTANEIFYIHLHDSDLSTEQKSLLAFAISGEYPKYFGSKFP